MKALGIDIGTTSISLLMLDAGTGEILGTRTIQSRAYMQGRASWCREQDPEKIYRLVLEGMEELSGRFGRFDVIGMTGQMHGMLYVDKNGQAVSPLYTWEDGRGSQILDETNGKTAVDLLKEKEMPAASGYGLTTHYYNARNGLISKDAVKMSTISDYVGMKLCGKTEPVITKDMAASWGCYDLKNGCFMTDELEKAGLDSAILPEILEKHGIIGTVSAQVPFATGIPVTTSVGDNQASFLGSVQDTSESVLLNVGTGSQISFAVDRYVEMNGSVELRPFPEDKYLMAGSSLCGGRAYEMLKNFYDELLKDAFFPSRQNTDYDMYAIMERHARAFKAEAKENAWEIRTTFNGTRDNPMERGSIANISGGNFRPGAMTLGMIRGIIEELYQMYMYMCRMTGQKASVMVGSGNGVRRNALLRETAGQTFGMKLKIPAHQEEAAYGAAILALASTGLCKGIEEAQKMIQYLPDTI